MNLPNSDLLSRGSQSTKLCLSESTRGFLARRFLQLAIRLARYAAFWEKAAFDCDPELRDKIERAAAPNLDALWAGYAAARDKAEWSNDIQDGIQAGRAWSRWLAGFCPEGQVRKAVHGDVVHINR